MNISMRAPKRKKGQEVGCTTHVGKLTLEATNDCEEVILAVLAKRLRPSAANDYDFMKWLSKRVKEADQQFARDRLRAFGTKKASVANES